VGFKKGEIKNLKKTALKTYSPFIFYYIITVINFASLILLTRSNNREFSLSVENSIISSKGAFGTKGRK